MSSVIGELSRKVGVATRPYRKAPMTTALPSYTTLWDVTAIERTFAWLGRNRRLAKVVEKLVETSTAMAAVAVVQLLLRRPATR